MNAQKYLLYKSVTTKIKNIYIPESNILHEHDISLVGYLDDTTWFGSS